MRKATGRRAMAAATLHTRERPTTGPRRRPPGGPCPPATLLIHCGAVHFEKWQALGNDYVIVEASELPFELTPARIQAICAPHTGVFADGILLLSAPEERGFVARLQIFNPDGSEAELSGNGAREAVLYLRRRGWTDSDTFSIQTAAGEIRPRITSETECTVDMGRARRRSGDYPSGGDDGIGELTADARTWRFQHVQVGNPQCAIRVDTERDLDALDLPAIGPAIEHHELFPHRTNVSWFTPTRPGPHSGPDLRARGGGDVGQRHGGDGSRRRLCAGGRRFAGDRAARGRRARPSRWGRTSTST